MDTSFLMAFTVDDSFQSDRFIKLRLRVCHDGESPNHTYFTREIMEDANKTLEYIPLLAHVFMDENGTPIMGAHDMHVEENRFNPEEGKIIYDEVPIGVVPSLADNNCEIAEFDGRNYTFVDCYVWRDYANYAEEIVEMQKDIKLSMEIDYPENALSFDAENNRYNISSYRYRGITLLNNEYGTGMAKAMATTGQFDTDTILTKMHALMDEISSYLREHDINNSEKGEEEVGHLNELLAQYNLSIEDLDFEYENLSDEDLDHAFEDYVSRHTETDEDTHNETPDAQDDQTPDQETQDDETEETIEDEPEEPEQDQEPSEFICSFRISHDDIRYSLQSLLNEICDDSHFYFVESVFDKYFYYCDYYADSAYKQSYKIRKNIVSFDGEPEKVYREFVTQSERDELETMRQNYSGLVEFRDKHISLEKKELFASEDYSIIANQQEFTELVSGSDDLTVEQCREKADTILGRYTRKLGTFSRKEDKNTTIPVGFEKEGEDTYKPYGNLF